MPSLTIRELMTRLALTPYGKQRGNNFLSLVAKSGASSVRKKSLRGEPQINVHYKALTHHYGIDVQTGFDITKRINKLRKAEGEEPREVGPAVNGHVKIAPQIVQQQNGNIGLACEVLRWDENGKQKKNGNIGVNRYVNNVTGEVVSKEYLAPFMPEDDRDIDYLTPNLCNIVSVTMDGETFQIDASDYQDVCAELAPSLPTMKQAEVGELVA